MPENTTVVTVVARKRERKKERKKGRKKEKGREKGRGHRRPVPGRQCGTQSGIFVALTSRWCV